MGISPSSYVYIPNPITVVIGVNNTITWVNTDSSRVDHTVTSDGPGFDSGNIAPGAGFTCTLTIPGTWNYHCVYHPLQVGTMFVKSP